MEIVMVKILDNCFIVLELVINIDNMLDICFWFYSWNNIELVLYWKVIYKKVVDLMRWCDILLVRGNVKGDFMEGV